MQSTLFNFLTLNLYDVNSSCYRGDVTSVTVVALQVMSQAPSSPVLRLWSWNGCVCVCVCVCVCWFFTNIVEDARFAKLITKNKTWSCFAFLMYFFLLLCFFVYLFLSFFILRWDLVDYRFVSVLCFLLTWLGSVLLSIPISVTITYKHVVFSIGCIISTPAECLCPWTSNSHEHLWKRKPNAS